MTTSTRSSLTMQLRTMTTACGRAFRPSRPITTGRFVTLVAFLAVIGAPLEVAQGAADPTASQVLDRARQALGGPKLAAVTSVSAKGSYRRTMGERDVSGELTVDLQLPDKFLRTESMTLMGDAVVTRETGLNGSQLLQTSKTSGGGPGMFIRMAGAEGPAAEAQMLRAQQDELARHTLVWLLTAPAGTPLDFTYAGEAQAEDGKADVIDVKGADNFAARLFIDKETHRPLMLSYKGVVPRLVMQTMRAQPPAGGPGQHRPNDPQPAPPAPEHGDIQLFFSDYKNVEGVQLPHHIARSVNGNPTEEWTITKFKVNAPIKPETFEKR
jgi:hypothetical protein